MAKKKIDSKIAEELNQLDYRSGTGLLFKGRRVYMLRRDYGIPGPYKYLKEQGFLTAEELADRLGASHYTVVH